MAPNYCSAEEAIQLISNNQKVFIHGSAATPLYLWQTLLNNAQKLQGISLYALSTCGTLHWNEPETLKAFYLNSLFVSENVRDWVNSPYGEYIPVFLSEIPGLFERKIIDLDVAIVHVSPPDDKGYCTLGTSTDIAISAVKCAKTVIAQVNPQMPRVMGDGIVHYSKFSAMVWHDAPLPEVNYALKCDEISTKIGKLIAPLIDDGATLQMGIGAIPDAVLSELQHHKDLGVHTEMFSDGAIPLIESGVINNSKKKVYPGKVVTSFVLGTKKLYQFIDNNPIISCLNVAMVNDVSVIRKNPKVIAINSTIEIDLTGQVCADSIGTYQYSGIGGQMDFIRGASLSEGGKPIIALPSITGKGISRIVPFLKEGAGVVTSRGHTQFVVTEYGVVNLYGKNLAERSAALISIAHPMHRNWLEEAYFKRFGTMP